MNSIDIFPWNDNFNTGIPLIDEQHKKLADLINLLASHVAFNANIPALNVIFDELAEYAVYHFDAEEKIWHEYMPQDMYEADHHKVHSSFLTEVIRLKGEESTKPVGKVIEGILAFLTRWLAAHILESDRSMAMVVKAIQSGLSLESAKKQAAVEMRGATRVLIDIILSIYESLSNNTLHLMRELAEQKRMTMLLDDQERHFETLLSTTPVGVFETDENGKCSYVNARWSEMTGVSLADAMGDGWVRALHPEDKNKVYAEWVASTSENRPFQLEYRFQYGNGKTVWVLGQSANYKSKLNDRISFISTVTDITDRKKSELALLESQNLLSTIIDRMPVRVFWKDKDLRYLGCNTAFANDAGLMHPNDLIGKNDYQLGWSSQAELYRADDLAVIESGIAKLAYEEPQTTPSGQSIWLRTSKVPLKSLHGDLLGVLGIYEDTTVQKQAANEMQLREGYQRALLDNFPFMVWMKDANGHFLAVNQPFAMACGQSSSAIIVGKTDLDIWPLELAEGYQADDRSVLESGNSKNSEELIYDNGKPVWYETYKSPIVVGGVVTGSVGFARDISDRKQVEKELTIERQRLSSIIEGTRSGTWEWNVQTGELFVNQRWANITGYELSELEPISIETWSKLVHSDDGKISATLLEKHFSGELAYYECEARMQHKDGGWIWVLDRGKVITWTLDGKPLMMAGTHQEITARKQVESELRVAATVFESKEGMMVTDASSIILRVNQAFTKITGYSAEEAIGQTPRLLSSGKQEKSFYTAMWQSISDLGAWEGEIWNRRKSGEVYPENLAITAVNDAAGIIANYVATFTDITMSKAASDAIKTFAFYDPLTQLPNRRLLVDRLSQIMASSNRSKAYGALMFLDLDNFKPLNDTHGHVMGDRLLIEAAQRLTSCMRNMDTVARFGGDEFVVMLAELDEDKTASIAQAAIVAEKILAVMSEPYLFTITHDAKSDTTIEHRCTASIGVVMFIDHESNQDEVMNRADAAMYEAKDAGRNQIKFYGDKS